MKVLNISTSSLSHNGIGMFLINYFNNMNDSSIKKDYVVPNKVEEELKKQLEDRGSNVFELYLGKEKLKQKRPLEYCIRLYKIIRNGNYDIIHVHGSSSMMFLELLIAKLAGCKIRIAHSHNTKADFSRGDKLLRPIFNLLYTHAFACGEEAGRWLFKDKDFITINNGQDIDKFKFDKNIRHSIRLKYNLDDKIIIGHVGSFNYQKNHEFLIEVFRELCKDNDKYCLLLIGDGDLRINIENKVKEYNLEKNVLFVGITDEVNKWLQAADIMLLPSRFEGFPNVLVEWQIAGLPCIISDKVTDKVKITNLVQFASIDDNPQKWADIIEKVEIKDREKEQTNILKDIKQNGFDIKENAKKLENIYYQLIGNSIEG